MSLEEPVLEVLVLVTKVSVFIKNLLFCFLNFSIFQFLQRSIENQQIRIILWTLKVEQYLVCKLVLFLGAGSGSGIVRSLGWYNVKNNFI